MSDSSLLFKLNLLISYKVRELLSDLLLHPIKPKYQLLIARNPVNDRIRQVLQILCLFLANIHFNLSLFLEFQSEITTTRDSLSTQFQAFVHLGHWSLNGIKAVHATPRTFIIHNVEFFVQKCVEPYLSVFESLIQVLKYLFIHVINSILSIFRQFEELAKLSLRLSLRVKVHVQLLLQVLPGFCILSFLRKRPRLPLVKHLIRALRFILFPKHSRFICFRCHLLLLLGFVELLLSKLVVTHLSLEDV